ncbi:MAG TPA: hypothetical protein VHL98_00420 [Microvirga sp.]|jgi:hypothetical protein|nr:hypothetical protein [Microvirga sp.]
MSRRPSRERSLPRTEAEDFFRDQGARSPVGPFLWSMAILNVASAIVSLATQ